MLVTLASPSPLQPDYLYASRPAGESAPREDVHFQPIEPRSARVTLIKNW